MNQLSLLKPSYIVNLKLGKVADFRKIPRKELSHYFEPNHYKTSTVMGRVIPYKEHCKCAYNSKTKTGLFPPEVLLIHTINNEGRPYHKASPSERRTSEAYVKVFFDRQSLILQ